MAKRLSTKEILEAARRGAPAAGAPASGLPTAAPETSEVEPEATPQPVAPAAFAQPPAAPLGRPLTLKEKLAAARAGAPAPSPATAPTPKKPSTPAAAEGEPSPAAAMPGTAPTAPAAPIGRPMTLSEKLAAARGVAGGSAPAAKPATPKAPGAPSGAAKAPVAKRELPPLESMTDPKDLGEALRQAGARKEKEVAEAAKAKEPAAKPAREKETRPQSVLPRPTREGVASSGPVAAARAASRRTFLFMTSAAAVVWVAWGFFAAGVGAFTLMLGRFMFPNVLAEPPSTIKVGLPTNYDADAVNERFKAEWGFWIVRSTRYDGQDIVYALKSVCTHLGCPPNWLVGEQKFKCPCHGSGFYISGVNFEGPAPRPLERFKITLADDGQIVVDKSQVFQQELGQWSDPDSFITA